MTRRKLKIGFGVCASLVAIVLLAGAGWGTTTSIDPNATLIVAIDQPFGSIDPRNNHASLNARPLWNLFDGIVTKTWYNGSSQLKLVPGLASSWTISKNRLTYTFKLRKGIKFADGSPFNADAAVFNFRVLFDPSFQFFYAAANPFAKSFLPTYSGVKAVGPYTFQLTLTAPDAGTLDNLATHEEFFMVSPKAVQTYGNAGIGSHPIGTGPFSFDSFDQSTQTMVANRNDAYWRGPSKIKRLIMRTITDTGARTAALEAKQVHIATNISVKNKARWLGRKDISLVVRDQPTIKSCHFNWRNGVGTNKLFRQAVSLAVNRVAMSAVVYGTDLPKGMGGPAHGFFPPQSAAYDPKMPALKFDLVKAKKLLKQSGVATGTTLTLESPTGDENATNAFSIMQEQVRQIGINLVMKYVDSVTYVRDLTQGLPAGSPVDGLCRTTLGTDTPSLIFAVFAKSGWPPSGFNAEFITVPGVESAYIRARNAKNNAGWLKAISDANHALVNATAGLFLINDVQGFGEVGNVRWTPAAARDYMYYSAVEYKK